MALELWQVFEDEKTPNEVKPYAYSWEPELGPLEQTIASNVWSQPIDSDLVIEDEDEADNVLTFTASGGSVGNYPLTTTIETSGGMTLEKTVVLKVRDA